jgi:hypothetical protein
LADGAAQFVDGAAQFEHRASDRSLVAMSHKVVSTRRRIFEEADDSGGDLFALLLLQEVAGAGDDLGRP